MPRALLFRSALVAAVLAAIGCGGAAPATAPNAAGAKKHPSKGAKTPKLVRVEGPRLLPDLSPKVPERESDPDGTRRVLYERMRVVMGPDGSVRRAKELFPRGKLTSVALPSRLGGGYAFAVIGGSGTLVWRSDSWLGPLEPLISLSGVADDDEPLVAGFDRLYLRLQSGNRLLGLDPETGQPRPLGSLPLASAFGPVTFADGWRGVVDADLRGPLATFDAGSTWRSVDVEGRVYGMSTVGGNPIIRTSSGLFSIDGTGRVTRLDLTPEAPTKPADAAEVSKTTLQPLGPRPLRVALSRGFPDSPTSSIVADHGHLFRVSLEDGRILERREDAYEETEAGCHGVHAGPGFGFLCGEREGATVLYRYEAALGLSELARFAEPRFVSPSGNGWVVVRGSCGASTETDEARPFCVVAPSGAKREIRVRGNLGAERIVALRDGRVAVIVPPGLETQGQLSIIEGSKAKHLPLKLPESPRAAADEVRRGMWMHGFEERRPGVLGGWVESGGPVVGIEIELDGTVTAGEVVEANEGAVLSGRYAIVPSRSASALETTDGGMTFRELDLPELDGNTEQEPDDEAVRACGPAGCVLAGWLRVGWGEDDVDDLRVVEEPDEHYFRTASASGPVEVACRASGKATRKRRSAGDKKLPPLASFRGQAAPELDKDQVGVEAAAPFDLVPSHVYVWGRKGADWTRAGQWLIRFDDRFALDGVRSSAVTASPWSSETLAAEAIGAPSRGFGGSWASYLDVGGRAALLSACGGGSGCSLYAVEDGEPISMLRNERGGLDLPRPLVRGAVKRGETWFFLTAEAGPDVLNLYRVDLGTASLVRQLMRPSRPRYSVGAPPTLVRRRSGEQLGLAMTVPPQPGEAHGELVVLPLDAVTGELSEPIRLGTTEWGARTFRSCGEAEDGWVLETTFERPPPILRLGADLDLEALEARLVLDPGRACVEGLAARVEYYEPAGDEAVPGADIGLALTRADEDERSSFRCRVISGADAP